MQAAFAVGAGGHWLRDRPGLRILVYHGVVPAPIKRINARFVSTAQLDAHVAYLKKHFQVISLDQAFAEDYDPHRLAVVLTFDDGYRNNLIHALPVLQKHGLPATVFVTAARAAGQDILWPDLLDIASAVSQRPVTIGGKDYHKNRKGEYVDTDGHRLKADCKAGGPEFIHTMQMAFQGAAFRDDPQWNDYWQLLDAAELRQLAETPGITIGGHGTLHHSLPQLTPEDALQDVKTGIAWIEAAIGKQVKSFAFPDGAYTPALVEALAAQGLSQLLLIEHRFQDQADARLRERFTIHPFLPTRVLMAEILKGHYF